MQVLRRLFALFSAFLRRIGENSIAIATKSSRKKPVATQWATETFTITTIKLTILYFTETNRRAARSTLSTSIPLVHTLPLGDCNACWGYTCSTTPHIKNKKSKTPFIRFLHVIFLIVLFRYYFIIVSIPIAELFSPY